MARALFHIHASGSLALCALVRSLWAAMGVTMALVLGASVLAAQLLGAQPLTHAEGVITRVDASSVSIKGADGEVKLQLTRNTTIFVHGRTGSSEDLKVGQTVRGAYERGGGVQWLEVLE